MFHVLKRRLLSYGETNRMTVLLLAFFLAGIVFGALIGSYADEGLDSIPFITFSAQLTRAKGFLHALLHSAAYLLILIVCGSSVFGVLAVPTAAFMRALSLSCCVAAICRTGAWREVFTAFLALGIPALLGVPSFLITAEDAMRFSQRLLSFASGRQTGAPDDRSAILRRAAAVLFLTALEALYCSAALPRIYASLS